ncbi:MAG TPA: hypothetical protein VFA41_10075 [Ktedonobacteraceae bacterium]|nr:hypothetical protein [Ktedonobacteraceae bacterium]
MNKKAEKKRVTFLANIGDYNRPLRVRPVNVEGRNWWAIDAEDTWPGMVMDLRRLGFESMAWGEEVLVRESMSAYEPQMDGPAAPEGLKPFPTIQSRIQIRRDSISDYFDKEFMDEDDEDFDMDTEEDEFAPDEDQQYE